MIMSIILALVKHFPVKSTQLDSIVKPKFAYQALAVDFLFDRQILVVL